MANENEHEDVQDPKLAAEALKDTETEIDYDKLDYSKIDPSKIPHHLVQHTEAFSGVLRELQDVRNKVATLDEANENLMGELKGKDEDLDPDEPVTQTQLQEAIDKAVKANTEQLEKNKATSKEQQQTQKESTSIARLRQDFSTDKTTEQLDADTVLNEGGTWLLKNKPKLFEAARASDDPAREIYDLSVSLVPSIRKRARTAENTKLLEDLQGRKSNIPAGPGGAFAPGSDEASELQRLIETPEEQLLDLVAKDELG